MPARTILRGAVAALATLGLAAPQALAAPTRTHVSNPQGSPTFVTYNVAAGGSLPVAGTSNGGTARLDLRCDAGGSTLLKSNILPAANGSWSLTLVSSQLNLIAGHACVLRAVPHLTHPASRSAFSGPTVAIDALRTSTVGGGPNNGQLYDFNVAAPQLQGRASYASLGGCSLGGVTVQDPATLAETPPIFSCAGRVAGNASGRAGIKV